MAVQVQFFYQQEMIHGALYNGAWQQQRLEADPPMARPSHSRVPSPAGDNGSFKFPFMSRAVSRPYVGGALVVSATRTCSAGGPTYYPGPHFRQVSSDCPASSSHPIYYATPNYRSSTSAPRSECTAKQRSRAKARRFALRSIPLPSKIASGRRGPFTRCCRILQQPPAGGSALASPGWSSLLPPGNPRHHATCSLSLPSKPATADPC